MTERGRRTSGSRALLAAVGILTLLTLGGAVGVHAEEPGGVSGRVVNVAGAGVGAATVWAIRGTGEEPEAIAETTTDDQGAFAFLEIWARSDPKVVIQQFGL